MCTNVRHRSAPTGLNLDVRAIVVSILSLDHEELTCLDSGTESSLGRFRRIVSGIALRQVID